MKKLIIPILLLALIGGYVGWKMYHKTLDSVADLSTQQSVSSIQLLADYETDEAAANIKYTDKVVEISGEVGKVETVGDAVSIYLKTDNDMSSVICQLEKEAKINVGVGDKIIVKGICTGYLMDVIVVRSIISNK